MIISNPVDKTANISLQKDTLLIELTAEESSSIVGGFTIRNDSGGTRRFYNLGANVPAQVQTLQPNTEGTYDGEYIIYNTSKTGFEPVLVKVDPTKTASFRQEGNGITVTTDTPILYKGSI
ncbi:MULTISPECIES: hypothetical protein [Aphanizomenonaceae]|uniref:Uncharacterized protein n=1 Tax=Dolichospermum heterosporum TAC447 TaxID=747523 RepID=A0ABY5LVL0_9CYAN|nr:MULTISPECIES: hypothetical protein [Aphanizomenonaceae]MBE9256156.1 hypothetical protein [Dolichospermum sp. LEGE 00246]UUO14700.1 hypothetical protein NG743_22150 [Dolichospermum heterosporum TAC447]